MEETATEPVVLVERRGDVAIVVLNRPRVHNAISFEMQARIAETFRELGADASVRVIVLRGAGERAFSAGADIKEFATRRTTDEEAQAHYKLSQAALDAIAGVPQPTIAMINGVAVGNGCLLALSCDVRLAGASARLGITSAKRAMGGRGSGGPSPTMRRLTDLVGPSNAKLIFFTGRLFPASQALQMGLVNLVYPDAELAAAVHELAEEIAANPPDSVQSVKEGIDRTVAVADPPPSGEHQVRISEDYQEGIQSFLEKRPPNYRRAPGAGTTA
jgi:enoyl-CoA hydratase/carnithine racemase